MDLQDYYFKMPLKTEPIIDDTTLRDGIQMPGLAAGPKDSAKIAQFLADVGVERIELFHYQEPDKKAIKLIFDLNLNLRVAGWCRALKEDIDSAVACGFKEVGISHRGYRLVIRLCSCKLAYLVFDYALPRLLSYG